MAVLPIIMNPAGYVPQTPAQLNAQLIAGVTATNPGYTANLPGSLVEDISSTDTYALLTCDSAFGELVNSITPFGANPFILNELGQMLGVELGEPTNTSVNVIFSGPPGFVIAQGFVVSDGTHQYGVQDGGVIGSSGQSPALFAVATDSGSWTAAAGVVNQIITSVPSAISPPIEVSNPEATTPSTSAETQTSYRARVLQANLAASQGMARYFKTLVMNVVGVQPRLVSVLQQSGGGWSLIVGGGDPYQIAYAIYTSLFDISTLVGAELNVTGITKANPGVVTTDLDHYYVTGQPVTISGSNPSAYNGSYTALVISEKTFSIGIDTTGFSTYVGNAEVSPVLRNQVVSLSDYPDSYSIPFVDPPQQTVAITATWNTTSTNLVNPAAIAQLASPALVDYINNIVVGQPINLLQLDAAFQTSVANVLAPTLLTRLTFAVSINGVGASPISGTQIIVGDPSSYFLTDSTQITVNQG